jgi:hypothetical protein
VIRYDFREKREKYMEHQTLEIAKLIIGSSGVLGIIVSAIILIYKFGRFSQKFESLEKTMNLNFTEIKGDLKEIKNELFHIRDRVSRVEGQEDYARTAIIELWKRGHKEEGS